MKQDSRTDEDEVISESRRNFLEIERRYELKQQRIFATFILAIIIIFVAWGTWWLWM